MRDNVKSAFAIMAGLVFLGFYGWVGSQFGPNKVQQTDTAKKASEHNMLVSNCKTGALETGNVNDSQATTYCECAITKIEDLYPDFSTNEARLQRILSEGFNQSETDIMSACVDKIVE